MWLILQSTETYLQFSFFFTCSLTLFVFPFLYGKERFQSIHKMRGVIYYESKLVRLCFSNVLNP